MRVVSVRMGARSYSIRIVRGPVSGLAHELRSRFGERRLAIITDRKVSSIYATDLSDALRAAGYDFSMFEIGRGERIKRPSTVARIWQWLLENDFDRRTLVVALGGGIVGDVAGFAAATFMRGVDFVQVPTTLLAQVDSSVGGKTGVNLAAGKNVVGAFHQPRMVFTSLQTLRTLRPRDYRSGLGEVVKHGVISRPSILDTIRNCPNAVATREPACMEGLVAACCEVKRDVVEKDEHEKGLRQILNFGHSFGHAIEIATRHRKRHGEAIALGMLSACRVSELLGFCGSDVRSELRDVLTQVGFDTDDAPFFTPELVALMGHDKKRRGKQLGFVVVRGIGDVSIHSLELEELKRMTTASI